MHRYNWHAEKYIPVLMTYGFILHIIRVARYLRDGTADLSQIILPLVDLPLAILMAYCALAMIVAWREFFQTFNLRANWRKVAYWLIARLKFLTKQCRKSSCFAVASIITYVKRRPRCTLNLSRLNG